MTADVRVIEPSGDTTGAADAAAIRAALEEAQRLAEANPIYRAIHGLPEVGHDGPMRYTEAQRTQIAADAAGKTVQSLEWEGDGAYWVMTFTDGSEMSFRFMAEIAG